MNETNVYNQALSFFHEANYNESINLCNQILQKNSLHFYSWNLLGNIFFKLNELDKAQEFFITAININQNFVESYFMLGNILFSKQKYQDSINIWEEALKIDNSHQILYTNIAISCLKLNDLEKAKKYLDLVLKKNKNTPIEDIFICLGQFYKIKHDLINYKKNLKKALKINPQNPDTNFDLSYIYFLEKKYEKAYYHFEFRKFMLDHQKNYNYLPFKEYNFENLEKKSLLIYHEQGFGDNIQFVRFLNSIKCKDISFGIQNSLNKLFSYNFPNISFKKEITNNEYYDFILPSMSIPYFFKINTINNSPYLKVNEKDVLKFRNDFLDKKYLNIGLVYFGSKTSNFSNFKNISLNKFQILFQNSNMKFHSLQIENDDEINSYPNIKTLGFQFKDFYDTAVAICALDVIISVDTSVAHLTGALGQKGFILSHENQLDWRWEEINSKAVWYNSLKIFKYNDTNIDKILDVINKELNEL